MAKEGTPVASNKEGDNEQIIINDNLVNSTTAAIGDTPATSTYGDNDKPDKTETAIGECDHGKCATVASGINNNTTGDISSVIIVNGKLGDNNAGVSETIHDKPCQDDDVDSATNGEKLVDSGSDTQSEDMSLQDEKTDDDPLDKDVLDGEASAHHKSVDNSATVALETNKKATNITVTISTKKAAKNKPSVAPKKTAPKKGKASAKKKSAATKSGNNKKNNNNNDDTSMNSGKWNRDEKELLDKSLMDNGKDTSYEHMMTFVTTRNKQSIMSYYHRNKKELLRTRKMNVSHKEKNLEGGGKQGSEDEDLVAEKVGVVERVDSIVIIDEVIETEKRERDNPSVYNATYEDLTKFVQSYFAVIKEKVETENKNVVVPNVGTFYRDENGQMAVTHRPYPASKKHEEVSQIRMKPSQDITQTMACKTKQINNDIYIHLVEKKNKTN